MQVDELLLFLRENQETLIQKIREGKYKPNPVRRVEIPKEAKGEFRKLGQVDELLLFLRENQETLIQKIREGKYKPNPVRRVEIPKEAKGEFRKLGVPTVVDRVI